MNRTLKFTLAGIILLASCQLQTSQPECPTVPLTEKFMGIMVLRGDNAVTFLEGSYESMLNDVFTASLNKAFEDSIKLGDPLMVYDEDEEYWYSTEDLQRKMVWVDTQYVENPNPPHNLSMQVVRDTFDMELFHSIRTIEQWYLDDSLKLKREIKGYITVAENLDPFTGEVRGLEPYFYVANNRSVAGLKKIATVQYRQKVLNPDWDEWYRENLEASRREKMFKPLIKKAWSGEIDVYASPTASKPMTSDELKQRLCRTDTSFYESPAPPYNMEMAISESCEDEFTDQIIAIDLVQDIYLDDNMQISLEMKWYAPVMEITDPVAWKPTGETKTLFWIRNY